MAILHTMSNLLAFQCTPIVSKPRKCSKMARAAVSPWVWAFQLIFFIAPVQSIAFANAPSESHFAKVSLYVSGAENLTSTEVVCKQNESASVAIERHKRLGFADGKLPIWIVYEYSQEEKSHMVELSLLALKQHAPLDRFDIRLVNSSNAHDFIPDCTDDTYVRNPNKSYMTQSHYTVTTEVLIPSLIHNIENFPNTVHIVMK
eukprot:1679720-Amphidinium_carterae.1